MRLALTQLAFEGLPGVQVCGVELEREGKSYTWDTLTLLRGRFPKVKFSLLMGQDMLETIEQWYCAEQLLRTTPMVVYPRYGTAGGQGRAAQAGAAPEERLFGRRHGGRLSRAACFLHRFAPCPWHRGRFRAPCRPPF